MILARRAFGGGGGVDVDYNRVRKIIGEELKKLVFPEPKDVDFSPLTDSLQAILGEIRAIKIPEAEKVSFTPLMAKFDAVEAAIKAIEMPTIPTPEPVDLSPLKDALNEVLDAVKAIPSSQPLVKPLEQLAENVSRIQKALAKTPLVAYPTLMPDKEEEEEIDYSKLLNR